MTDQHRFGASPLAAPCGCNPAPARRACWRASCARSARRRPCRARCSAGSDAGAIARRRREDRPVTLHRQPVELDRKSEIRTYATTNTGTEKPSTENAITARSSQVPALAAAITPRGTATAIDTTSVQSVSASVGSTRCAIKLVTGRLVKIEVPRSPCSSAHSQRRTAPGKARRDRAWRECAGCPRGGDVAGDHGSGIARRQVEQREHDERDHRHDDDGRKQPPDDVRDHPRSTPRERTPLSLLDVPQKRDRRDDDAARCSCDRRSAG